MKYQKWYLGKRTDMKKKLKINFKIIKIFWFWNYLENFRKIFWHFLKNIWKTFEKYLENFGQKYLENFGQKYLENFWKKNLDNFLKKYLENFGQMSERHWWQWWQKYIDR